MKEWINRMTGRIRNHIVIASTVLALSLMALGAVTDLVVDGNGICSRAVNFINQIKISHALYLNQSALYNYADNEPIVIGGGTVSGTGTLINGSDAKTTPVDADNVAITNSADSHKLGKTTWANIKATLKTYFDGLYQAVMTKATSSDVTTGTDDAKYVTSKTLKDANIRANVQQIHNYTQDFTINSALNGSLITNHGATTDITGTFASGLSAGFWVDVANEGASSGIDSYTKLMLHMNGSNDGTTFTDSSASALEVIANGNAVTKTGIKKFGTASGYFDGTGDYLSIASTVDFNMQASGDWTVDFWINATTLRSGSNSIIHLKSNVSNNGLHIAVSNDGKLLVDNGLVASNMSAGSISTGTWHHIAIIRRGLTIYAYIDGAQVDSDVAQDYGNANSTCTVGYYGSGAETNSWLGYIDELRISKGIARWTADFTPPNAEYYSAKITLTPASGEQLPGTAAADNTLISSSKGDVKNFFNTGNSWISKYTNGTWVDGL